MYTSQSLGDNRHALTGTLYCGICEREMLRVGPNYVCAGIVTRGPDACSNEPANADRLLKEIMDQLMKLVMTEKTADSVVDILQERNEEATRRHRSQLDGTEQALDAVYEREGQALHAIYGEDELPTHDCEPSEEDIEAAQDQQQKLDEITNVRVALKYEARLSRRELDGLAFMGDEERLRANALNLENYRNPNYSEYTARIIRMFLKSVGVSPEAVTLNFTMPVPTDDEPEGTLSTVIQFG